jgi:hypothetical protein
MTPKEILEQESFDPPTVIVPGVVNSFEDLLLRLEDIRCLRLVPVKHDDMQALYKKADRAALAHTIIKKFSVAGDIFIADNEYPYFLPKDVRQQIIWINDNVCDDMVLRYIEDVIWMYDVEQYILFERSTKCTSKLIKGTIPQVRHIHFWTKKK